MTRTIVDAEANILKTASQQELSNLTSLVKEGEKQVLQTAEKNVIKNEIIPDDAIVVRGGLNTPKQIEAGTGTHPSGVTGVSVECETCGIKELSKSLPHNQIGVSTVGEIRKAGGDVIRTSGKSQYHATLSELTAKKIGELLNPVPSLKIQTNNKHNMITEQELKEIEQRCSLAQSMPWKAYIEGRDHESGSSIIKTGESDQKGEDMEIIGATNADLDFIAHARQDSPKLIEEIRNLRKLLK